MRQAESTANAVRPPMRPAARPTLPTRPRAPREFLGADVARTRIRALPALVSGRSRGATAWERPQALQCARLPLGSEEPDLLHTASSPCAQTDCLRLYLYDAFSLVHSTPRRHTYTYSYR